MNLRRPVSINNHPMPPELPPLLRDQRKIDADHLRLIALFHFIFAGLALVGLGFLALHWLFMSTFLGDPSLWKDQKSGPPPEQFFAIFRWFYAIFGVLIVSGGIANLISGLFIRARKNRTFSIVVAALNCIQMPFGTALGVFTLIVLTRESVREGYSTDPR
ncbi:hypothetical protein [Nibricoccus aquaticus]|uniref:hypothetical protein n=1 Tax=Nibricoccus aquaticus TaxID=2576891 RepID=UPI0010FE98FB|nr:hypothetical protein [Nibricoccus aquaticus]